MNTNNGFCECGCGEYAPIADKTQTNSGTVKGQPRRFVFGHHRIGKVACNSRTLSERFWEKVNKQGPLPSVEAVRVHPEIAGTRCWEWTACVNVNGYGNIGKGGRGNVVLAHRAAWFLETGEWPEPCALHKCDNPRCVRFSHLFEGTHQENVTDRERKGRGHQPQGEHVNTSKLTEEQVQDIRKALAQPKYGLRAELAKRHNVLWTSIEAIRTGANWKHIQEAA